VDVVAAILVHFRALDTLGEIIVFSITALGVLVLTRRLREERS
jgi:multisubunit Na+/H+ antiporter MnhB subunit